MYRATLIPSETLGRTHAASRPQARRWCVSAKSRLQALDVKKGEGLHGFPNGKSRTTPPGPRRCRKADGRIAYWELEGLGVVCAGCCAVAELGGVDAGCWATAGLAAVAAGCGAVALRFSRIRL